MNPVWLISYVVLWILVAILALLTVGLLQQLGFLQREFATLKRERGEESSSSIPPLDKDGPDIGASLPERTFRPFNGHQAVSLAAPYNQHCTVLLFLTITCESCQHMVEFINEFLQAEGFQGTAVTFLRADTGGCQAFQQVFPLNIPTICDDDHSISMEFEIHRFPLGLFYDAEGKLLRKGIVQEREDLLALLGDGTASPEAQAKMFPTLYPALAPSSVAAFYEEKEILDVQK